jgi:RNA-directed DNA polymerase
MKGTLRPDNISTRLLRVAELAREAPELVFTTLAHHIDIEFLKEAFKCTRKSGAVGVDGQDAATYAENLDENLESLLNRFKSGSYKAPPVRRVHIPKGDGNKTRPIGIPSFEDKVLQRAVVMILEAIYEQDFLDCSFGYRPGRSAHQALEVLWKGLKDMGGGWVVEIDIKDFFGNLDHTQLRSFLSQRVRDGVIRRTIDKWLAAGVLEDGQLSYPESGSPQGGVVSPIVSNLYLHEVMDKWFEHTVKPVLSGQAFMIRVADDIVCVFEKETDARRFYEVLPKRFAKYGLELHERKTKLIDFKKPPSKGSGKTESFDLLGFTHKWGLSRRGYSVVQRVTSPDRLRRAVNKVYQWCKKNRHMPLKEQHQMLVLKLNGHYGYYGITGNSRKLQNYQYLAKKAWFKWLSRRSQKAALNWERFSAILERYPLPPARVVHSVFVARP